MKLFLKLFLLMLFISILNAQVKISAGMGVDLVNNNSVKDYINHNFFDSENEVKSFSKALSLMGEVTYDLNKKYQLGIEYNHTMFFHKSPLYSYYEFNYTIYKPSFIGYYVIPGKGYELKFGAGAGLRYVVVEEKIFSTQEYTSTGAGILFKFSGNTALGGDFYANISADARYDYLGEPENNGVQIVNNRNKENVNLNNFSFGIKLGVSYFIN